MTHKAITKVVCVGRNYAAHAKELGNEVPTTPVIFMKPPSAVVSFQSGIDTGRATQEGRLGELHFECELCLQINKKISRVSPDEAADAIGAVTLGLDLTLRDLQSTLKSSGLPWERAKAFDGACVLGDWIKHSELPEAFELWKNGQRLQQGLLSHMLFHPFELIAEISQFLTLEPGDVIMTGTPEGVGPVAAGDVLSMRMAEHSFEVKVY